MVVISAAVTSKSGKVLLARQFIPITKQRIEGYLQAFPKLIGTDSQHTFIETEHIRYIYQPMEQLYILLITNKQSNIMEDLETLRTLAKLVPEYCGGHSEENVGFHSFELCFAFDEVISVGGYKENVTTQQIKTFVEMDSHEEKLQKIIMESKMNEARDEARRKAESIDKAKAEQRRLQQQMGGSGNSGSGSNQSRYGGSGGGSSGYGSGYGNNDSYEPEQQINKKSRQPTVEMEEEEEQAPVKKPIAKPSSSIGKSVKGMQLGKAKKTEMEFFAQINKEEKLVTPPARAGAGAAGAGTTLLNSAASTFDSTSSSSMSMSHDSVRVVVDEKINVSLERDGGVKRLEVKGEMKLSIFDPDDSKIIIQTNGPLRESDGFKCLLHPKINKSLWASKGELGLSDATKSFPVGSDNAPIILKYRKSKAEESEVPLTLNFWPNVENGQSVVSVEYSCEKEIHLSNVRIVIPCASSSAPEISSCDGDYKYEAKQRVLVWHIGEISDSNKSGSFEFSVPELDSDAFYPITIDFTSTQTFSGIEVTGVTRAEGGEQTKYTAETQMSVEKYTIE